MWTDITIPLQYHNILTDEEVPFYFSCIENGGQVDLYNIDDKSGRQQWIFIPINDSIYNIGVNCGVPMTKRFLSVGRGNNPQLCLSATNSCSDSHQWRVLKNNNDKILILNPSSSLYITYTSSASTTASALASFSRKRVLTLMNSRNPISFWHLRALPKVSTTNVELTDTSISYAITGLIHSCIQTSISKVCGTSANSVTDSEQDNFECLVCFEQMELPPSEKCPKLLPCNHTFCGVCIPNLLKNSDIKCPLCNHVHRNVEASAIKNDLRLIRKMEKISECKCENCEVTSGTHYCEDCGYLCGNCLKGHNFMKSNHRHVVMTISEVNSKLKKTKKCSQHSNETIKYYCFNCKVLICRDCVLLKHTGSFNNIAHNVEEIRVLYKKNLTEISNAILENERKLKIASDHLLLKQNSIQVSHNY